MMFVLQGIVFENSCNGFSFVWPRRQHKLENNGIDTDKIKGEVYYLQELLPHLKSYPNLSELIRNYQVLISKSCFNQTQFLSKCPMKPRYFWPLLFQANEALKASRGNTPKDFALVADDGFKHDFRFRSTKRESTPRKRSGISRCWISLSWGIRCWISNQLYEFK